MRNAVISLAGVCLVLLTSSRSVAAEPTNIPELALQAMQYRVGQWESTGFIDGVKQDELGRETTEWTPGRYAICCVGHFYEDGKEVHSTGLIGWDPERQQLVEEWYASDGSKAAFFYSLDAEKQSGIGTFKWVYGDGRKLEGKSVIQVNSKEEWEWNASYEADGKKQSWRTINRRVK